MQKLKTMSGYTAYKTTRNEVLLLGGIGICDSCAEPSETGYLIPVLNHWLCPACYAEWDKHGTYYPEDVPAQERNAAYYESIIPITKEVSVS